MSSPVFLHLYLHTYVFGHSCVYVKAGASLCTSTVGSRGTANYVARLYGVRAAMPGFIAVEMVRQPQLVGAQMPPDELSLGNGKAETER